MSQRQLGLVSSAWYEAIKFRLSLRERKYSRPVLGR